VQANLGLIQQMGATSIRDEVHWSSVERQKGQYAIPANSENFVNASLAKGIKPLQRLFEHYLRNLADPLILQSTESPVCITGGTLQVQ
jgi:hypothetical protein